eukprot:CAMPEP_0175136820 /NCGR_PEP_ID=MMETSP0087-20121206/9483_1 /TAXON_ID=136419 /ORGANISM="Unknown Unknown, Strain D1" /LENGTH=1921 /DNA_ID=CAMNT_0016419609 /DNA_START=50 /DNA_END=5815 /DNA_ORIENTATION=+
MKLLAVLCILGTLAEARPTAPAAPTPQSAPTAARPLTPVLLAHMAPYPGQNVTTPGRPLSGKVMAFQSADGKIVMSYSLSGLADTDGGLHIHAGTSCEDAQGHYWTPLTSPDPWKTTNWVGGKGSFAVSNVGYSISNCDTHAVVVHNKAGARVMCGILRRISSPSLYPHYANIGRYPGLPQTSPFPSGKVFVRAPSSDPDRAGKLFLDLNLEGFAPNITVYAHIHEGTSCEDASKVGGHYWDKSKFGPDPWNGAVWTFSADAYGVVRKGSTLERSGLSLNDVVGKAVVLHAGAAKTRVGCGVIAAGLTMERYPQYTGPLNVQGALSVFPSAGTAVKIEYDFAGLEANKAHYVHVHTGVSCAASFLHYYNEKRFQDDPWTQPESRSRLIADQFGAAVGSIAIDYGWGQLDTFGHAVVVHDSAGNRIGCSTFSGHVRKDPPSVNTNQIGSVVLTPYPGTALTDVQGSVAVTSVDADTLAFHYSLQGLEGVKGGLHVHTGTSCQTAGVVGGHLWNVTEFKADPWNDVSWTASPDDSSKAKTKSGTVAVKFGLSLEDIFGRAVVVHAADGSRVMCGTLISAAKDLDLFSPIGRYPGMADKNDAPYNQLNVTGHVRVRQSGCNTAVVEYDVVGLPANEEAGLHVHAGTTCEASGGHFWDAEQFPPDPWSTKYKADANGQAKGSFSISNVGYTVAQMVGHAVVLHAGPKKQRVACGIISSDALINRYPGYQGELKVVGSTKLVPVRNADGSTGRGNELRYFLSGLPNGGSMHVHVGATCSRSGGHWYTGATDPWNQPGASALSVNQDGVAMGVLTLDYGYDHINSANHAVVVHDDKGTRVGCGVLAGFRPSVAPPSPAVPNPPKPAITWKSFGNNTVCRGKGNNNGKANVDFNLTSVATVDLCRAQCGPGCYGFEFNAEAKRCELWIVPVESSASVEGFECFIGTNTEIVIIDAVWGKEESCANRDQTAAVSAQCNGQDKCTYTITGQPDTCKRSFSYSYTCGGYGFIYQFNVGRKADGSVVEAAGKTIDLSCAAVMGTALLGRYPGAESTFTAGTVAVSAANGAIVLSWDLASANGEAGGGIHIHEGSTCETSGPHFWKPTTSPDPWGKYKWSGNTGSVVIPDSGLRPAEGYDRTVVLHDSSGARWACGVIKATDSLADSAHRGSFAYIYGVGESSPVFGTVGVQRAACDTFTFEVAIDGLPAGDYAVVVDTKTTCDTPASNNNPFYKTPDNPYLTSPTFKAEKGKPARAAVQLTTGLTVNEVVGRAVHIHPAGQWGTRVACGIVGSTALMATYPGYKGPLKVRGSVTVVPGGAGYRGSSVQGKCKNGKTGCGARLFWSLSGLEADSIANVHVHAGKTCEDSAGPGGHFWDKSQSPEDPWTKQTSPVPANANGVSVAGVSAALGNTSGRAGFLLDYGYNNIDSFQHAIVVHDQSGARVACGVLNGEPPFTPPQYFLSARFGTFPGLSRTAAVDGFVIFAQQKQGNLVGTFDVGGLGEDNNLNIQIRTGYSCASAAEVGEPYAIPLVEGLSNDAWRNAEYTDAVVDAQKKRARSFQVATGYDLTDADGHAVVLLDGDSKLVGCGVLQDSTKPRHYATIGPYPGYTGGLVQVGGTVFVEASPGGKKLRLTYDFSGLKPNDSQGMHIHLGQFCDKANDVGGHYWLPASVPDPWNAVLYTSDQYGQARGSVEVEAGLTIQDVVGHAFVVHSGTAGTRVGCGVISSTATMAAYPGYKGPPIFGSVSLTPVNRTTNEVYYMLGGLDTDDSAGVHVHEGTACSASGGHLYKTRVDPWNALAWVSTVSGFGMGKLMVTSGYNHIANAGHALVVHKADKTATRAACGVLSGVYDQCEGRCGAYNLKCDAATDSCTIITMSPTTAPPPTTLSPTAAQDTAAPTGTVSISGVSPSLPFSSSLFASAAATSYLLGFLY